MQKTNKSKFFKWLGYIVLIYVIGLVLFFIIAFFVSNSNNSTENSETAFTEFNGDIGNNVFSGNLIPELSPKEGPDSAKIKIVEFSDFGCPFCKAAFPTIKQILNKYPDDVQLIYRHFPVDSLHPLATELAHASMCAQEQDSFWVFHDKIFQIQDNFDLEDLDTIATSVGMDSKKFRRCQDSQKYDEFIQKDFQDGLSLGARGTPTWIVNGERVEGVLPLSIWEQIIQELL